MSFLTFVTSKDGHSHLSSSSSSSSDSSDSGHHKEIKYKYILWFGDDVYRRESIRLRSSNGIFFIDAMNQAAGKDNDFKFEAKDYTDLSQKLEECQTTLQSKS